MKLILSYKYKLPPNNQQLKKLSGWLDMLRANDNWCLPDRVDGWHQQFICSSYSDRKQKGSKNRSKAQLRVKRLHNRIQQRRESY